METYKYTMDLRYIREEEAISQEIRSIHIQSMVIDNDYVDTCMPLIYMNISLDRDLVDHIIKNSEKNTMVLTVYRFIDNGTESQKVKKKYFKGKFAYFITEDVNPRSELEYKNNEDSKSNQDLYRNLTIGLILLDHIKNNKKTINTVLRNTTMMNAVYYVTGHMKMVIEPFTYNETLSEVLIKPMSSIAETIKYLNNIKVFYKTPFRYFMDFDCTYLLSSSGKQVEKIGDAYSVVLIVVRDILDEQAMEGGMITNSSQRNYQIDVSSADAQVEINRITENLYTDIKGVNNSGVVGTAALDVNIRKYSTRKTEIVTVPDSNKNMVDNIKYDNNYNSSIVTINKNDIDASIITPNKRYIIRNFEPHRKRDGDFILTRKQQLLVREDEVFTSNLTLRFRQVVK